MTQNVGSIDRAIRFLIGMILLAYAIPIGFPNTGWNWFGWIGLIPIITAIVGNCPLYSLLGLSTCRTARYRA